MPCSREQNKDYMHCAIKIKITKLFFTLVQILADYCGFSSACYCDEIACNIPVAAIPFWVSLMFSLQLMTSWTSQMNSLKTHPNVRLFMLSHPSSYVTYVEHAICAQQVWNQSLGRFIASWHLCYHSCHDLPITHQHQQLSQLSVTAVSCHRAARKEKCLQSNSIREE